MKLTERLSDGRKKTSELGITGSGVVYEPTAALKARLHGLVIDKLDLRNLQDADPTKMRERLRPSVEAMVVTDAEAGALKADQRSLLVSAIMDEIVGLGPIEPLLADPEITDILVNSFDNIYVERRGKLELTAIRFNDNTHLINIIQRIVSRVGRRVDESSPMVDARLPDGSRINAVVPPVAPDGAVLSIRRFGAKRLNVKDLLARGVCTQSMMKYLAAAVRAKCNLLISGGTGAGKTTLLNVLSSFIPKSERVVTIEDSAELSLQGHHVVRLEARPANIEGRGEVTIRSLVRNALRMRPDRIVIGEVRGAEVLDMLQAMNTGHEGSMATVHANNPVDAVDRLMMMLALSGISLSNENMQQFIGRSVRVVVQAARFPDGARRITHISEVVETGRGELEVRNIFTYSINAEGTGQGAFIYHGGSTLKERFLEHGIQLELSRSTT